LPIHIEVLIFGWIIQFTLGTAYWILPRFLQAPQRDPQCLLILWCSHWMSEYYWR